MKTLIKELRKDRNETQEEIAEIIGTTARTIGHYENDKREPDIETLIKLSEHFNVSIDYIVGNEKQKLYQLSDEELEIIKNYRLLETIDKKIIGKLINNILELKNSKGGKT